MADLLLEPATYDAMAQSSVEWADAHDWHEIAGRVEAVYEGAIHG
jgi:hypothetical protein